MKKTFAVLATLMLSVTLMGCSANPAETRYTDSVPYLHISVGNNGYTQVGRITGYATRKEAIEGLIKEIEEVWDAEDRD